MARPELATTLVAFKKGLEHLVESSREVGADPSCNWITAATKDAMEVYATFAQPVQTAVMMSGTRMERNLRSLILPWADYTIHEENVAMIRSNLIAYQDSPKLTFYTKALASVKDFFDKHRGIGPVEIDKLKSEIEKTTALAIDQLAASAICIAIYVTPESTTADSTRINNMQTTKKACLSVNAKLDYRLLARLDAAIKRLQSEQGAKRQKIK